MRIICWTVSFWMAWLGLSLLAQIDTQDSERLQKMAAYDFDGPKWKEGVSLDLNPDRVGEKIDEAGRTDSCEFIIFGRKALFCRIDDGMGLVDLLKAMKKAGLNPHMAFPVEEAFFRNQERGDGFLAGDGRALWAFEKKVDAMTDEVTYFMEVAVRQTGLAQGLLGVVGGAMFGGLLGQNGMGQPKSVALEFDARGEWVALVVGKGINLKRAQLRVDKNTFFELESPFSTSKPTILKQMLEGQRLKTRFYTSAHGQSVLVDMDLAGFQAAYDFMMWQVKGFSEK